MPDTKGSKAEDKAQEKKPLSEAEIKKQKAELTKFYKEETPILKLQADYEESITRIEIAKMTRLEIMLTKAQMMAGPPKDAPEGMPGDNPEEGPQRPERKLKPQE